tara:strand:+ start:279 stop:521 length:243 start_codon:yes stop_codon:yes gene_type:complete
MFQWLNGWFDNTPKSKKDKIKKAKADTAAEIVKKVMPKSSLMKLTKIQLEQMGRENGIELDRRKTKEKLVDRLHRRLSKK